MSCPPAATTSADLGEPRRASASHRRQALAPPVVGDLTLSYEGLELAADSGLRVNAYFAEPGTASAEAFSLLASWAGTPTQPVSPALSKE